MKHDEPAVILVVDNDPEMRRILSLRLEHAGHTCVTAASGGQALAEWQQRSFDLVVSDLNMPGGDGASLAEALQRSEAVPIIFLTGFRGAFERRLRGLERVTLLEKPFDIVQFMGIVSATLAGRSTGDDGLRVGYEPAAR